MILLEQLCRSQESLLLVFGWVTKAYFVQIDILDTDVTIETQTCR